MSIRSSGALRAAGITVAVVVALVATTARAQGRQFVAIAAGGGNILAFGLADK
jgi:hypothetical protein